ncbi:caspase family protein [Streptomyces sp. NPDC050617]|uniref:caspase, EACC1-associated type n=1 Tax=Streptomyces sp. NPDC050617 TaxID=3154628 RepID=UPI003420816F
MEPESAHHAGSHAILIGTSKYRASGLPNVPAASNSLHSMDQLLTDPELCGWPEDRVTVLEDFQDAARLALELRKLAEETTETLLVYFVGHGVISETGDLCLTTGDTDLRYPDLTALEYERVRRILLNSPAQVKLVILDCCYSGRVIHGLSSPAENQLAAATEVRGVYTLTAADRTAHVVPLAEQKAACTSFTGVLRDIIRQGVPGGPPTLALDDVYLELRRVLKERGLPEPNRRGTDTVDLHVFSRNAAYRPPDTEGAGFRLIPRDREDLFLKVMAEQPVRALTTDAIDALGDYPGIYQLYVASEGGTRELVYVGKGDRSISARLTRHLRKIDGRCNIDSHDVSFSYLRMDDDLSYVAPERLVVRQLHDQGVVVPWNLNGFGNNDSGRLRDTTRLRSHHFDALYPIDLSWPIRTEGAEGDLTAYEFANYLRSELPYSFRFQLAKRRNSIDDVTSLDDIPVTVPEGLLTADRAFRLLAAAMGKQWQISALAGQVLMYREENLRYPSAFRYYVDTITLDAVPDFQQDDF